MDKSDLMHFVNSVRWHCTILKKTTRRKEDNDRDVRGTALAPFGSEVVKIKHR